MKKVLAFVIVLAFTLLPTIALGAVDTIQVNPGEQGIAPGTSLHTLFGNAIKIIFVVAALAVLIMLIWGAFQWIVSGGDKEKVQHARDRITNALIGLAVLALAFFIARVVGSIVNINLFESFSIPSLQDTVPSPAPTKPPTPTPTIPGLR